MNISPWGVWRWNSTRRYHLDACLRVFSFYDDAAAYVERWNTKPENCYQSLVANPYPLEQEDLDLWRAGVARDAAIDAIEAWARQKDEKVSR